jgi:glucose/arabinose dehydrogenase
MEKNTGMVKIVLGQDRIRPDPFFVFNVDNQGERGALGLTFHPEFPDSPYVYCYVTIPQPVLANVIIRLVDSLGYGIHPDTIFRAPITSGVSNHNGGNIHFGPDGKLYVTIGENAISNWAQDTCRVQGKILRLNHDGSIPPDDPFPCSPVWAYGLRNSFDFCFHPVTGILYASENGPDANDEVNLITRRGNYGWPVVQCASTFPQFINALWCWTPTIAPTGIMAASNSRIPEFNGKLLMTDFNTGTLHTLTLSAGGDSVLADDHIYSPGVSLIDIEQGPDGLIYMTTGAGSIIRLRPPSSPPNPFPLHYPTNDSNVVNYHTSFVWGNTSDPDSGGSFRFHLQIARDSTFLSPAISLDTNGDTTATMLTDTLQAIGLRLYWRVLAIDNIGLITIGGTPQPEALRLVIVPTGDANRSGVFNGVDIVFLVRYFKGRGPAPDPIRAGDVNGDCVTNGGDIIYAVNYFKGGPRPLRGDCR